MQSLAKFFKEWAASTTFGISFLTILLITAFNITYMHGFGAQTTLKAADISHLVESNTSGPNSKIPIVSLPKRMLLPSVDLGVNIDNATINIKSNEWPLSATNAQYANFTPGLGNKKGTMLIYGHNTWSVMEKTDNLKIGDKLVLIDQNDKTWQFIYIKEEIVVPENVGFIYEDVPFRVVVFTCNGWNDQYRRLMFFATFK